MRAFATVAGLALLVSGCGGDADTNASGNASAPLTQIAAPNGDWTAMVDETPEGGFRMGNPNAPVKLVEYGSITCGHCAEFSEQATVDLRDKYVRSGQVSWEFRPFMLFPSDPGVTMLLRCQGPGPFFQLADQLYAEQSTWAGKLQASAAAMQEQLQAMSPQQRSAAMVKMADLEQFFRGRGMPQARIDACLADSQAFEDLVAKTDQATREKGVQGTPTFFINDRVVENASSWAALEPRLRAAIGG